MDALTNLGPAAAVLNYTHPHQQPPHIITTTTTHDHHHAAHTHWTDQLPDVDLMLLYAAGVPDPSSGGLINLTGDGAAASPAFADDDAIGNYTCASLEMTVVHRVLMSFYTFVFVGGCVGNAMIIYTVLRGSGMQTVTNRYILNLAIADECFLIGMPFLIATMNVGDWVFGEWMCKAYMVSTSITQFTSSLFLLIMSADRYVAICHHISSPKYRTPNVSRILSLVAWLVSAVLIWPIIRYADVIDKGNDRFTCSVVWPDGRAIYGLSFTLYTLVFAFLVPLGFILVFYGAVLVKLRRVSRRAQRSAKGSARHRKVTRLVLSVITAYVCCWTPYWIGQVALIMQPHRVCSTRLELVAFLATGCLGYLNSAINPVLYAYLSETFRKSLMKTMSCLRWCGNGGASGAGGSGGGAGGAGSGGAGGMQSKVQRGGCSANGAQANDGSDGRNGGGGGGFGSGGGGVRLLGGGGGGGAPKKGSSHGRRMSRGSDTQLTMVTRNTYVEANTMTTVTGLSSRNPSPPPQQQQQQYNGSGDGCGQTAGSDGDGRSAGTDNELMPLSMAAA